MTQTVSLLATWALQQLRLARVEIFCDPDNDRSIAATEPVRFHREGLLRGYREKHEERRDRVIYSLLPEDL